MTEYDSRIFASIEPAKSRSKRLSQLAASRLYLCTDARTDSGDLEGFLESTYAGGVDIIQLRDKSISAAQELAALTLLRNIARRHNKLFAVNDRADIAAVVGADILHVGQDDLSPEQARSLLGPDVLIGISTHAPKQAQLALANPHLDYFACGPVWETPTKPGRVATGLSYLEFVASTDTEKPWFAIGGVNEHTVAQVVSAGASRIVVVRALTQAENPEAAARALQISLNSAEADSKH